MAQQRGKREATRAKKRHPIRTLIVILLLIALIGVGGYYGPRLINRLSSPSVPGASAVTSQEDSSSAAVSEPTVSEPAVSEPVESEPEPTVSEPVDEPTEEPEVPETPSILLVNKDNPLPEDYTVEITQLSNGQSVATEIYPDLQRMFDDARAQGVYPIVASGFRTAEKQQQLMDERIQKYLDQGYSRADAEAEALLWVNPVGTSEHQTGLAVDINADGVHSTGQEVYDWLAQNAWKYGFILRYPENKTEITQTDYEPWHYRYVGIDLAKEIYDSGLCLEEFLAR